MTAKLVQPQPWALKIRALALELAIKAVPVTVGGRSGVTGAELLREAENLETWLKEAGKANEPPVTK